MLNSFIVSLAVGLLLGYLAGLGVGGGSLLILWLTLIVSLSQGDARAVNLLFFIFSAGGACIVRWKKGRLDLKRNLPAILSGCAAAGLTAWIAGSLNTELLRKPFGILLILMGLRELFYRPRELR